MHNLHGRTGFVLVFGFMRVFLAAPDALQG